MKKVVSFSLWGDNPHYIDGTFKALESARRLYPEWEHWFYLAEDVPSEVAEKLLGAGAKVIRKKRPEGEQYSFLPAFWRFLPACDRDVEQFIVRDLDSPITPREVAAVNEWLASAKSLHIMRDHPKHEVPILAGMWGALASELRNMDELIRNWKEYDRYGVDQKFLGKIVYPLLRDSSWIHSECNRLNGEEIHQFPTRREADEFVGAAYRGDDHLGLQIQELREWENAGRPVFLRPHMWSIKGRIRIMARVLWLKARAFPSRVKIFLGRL